MGEKKQIVCVGEGSADLVIDTRRRYSTKQATEILLEKGTANVRNAVDLSVGGTTANAAVAAAALGEPTRFFGKFGGDSYGKFVLNGLARAGVDVSWCLTDPEKFSNTVIFYLDENGERDGLIYPPEGSACAAVYPSEIPERIFENTGVLFTTGINLNERPMSDTVFELARRCRERGTKLVFDISLRATIYGWTDEMRRRYLEFIDLCDVVLGSGEEELAVVTGIRDPEKAARSLVRSDRVVVCKSGADGAALYTEDRAYTVQAYPVKVQDTIGAGDTFNGGFLAAYNRGYGLPTALQWGNAAAAYSIQFAGAGHGPDEALLLAFIKNYEPEAAEKQV